MQRPSVPCAKSTYFVSKITLRHTGIKLGFQAGWTTLQMRMVVEFTLQKRPVGKPYNKTGPLTGPDLFSVRFDYGCAEKMKLLILSSTSGMSNKSTFPSPLISVAK